MTSRSRQTCRRCGSARVAGPGTPRWSTIVAEKAEKPSRTHWDMLLERRSVEELEILLDERLELLRAGLLPGGAHLATAARGRKKTA